MAKTVVIYHSGYGHTQFIAQAVAKGANAQLVYVADGAEGQIESTLRFLLSPRAAYVSGQVIRIGLPVGSPVTAAPETPAQPERGQAMDQGPGRHRDQARVAPQFPARIGRPQNLLQPPEGP